MAELIDDNALLGADDDELDYDLEKDEEDALLADPDNENFDEQFEEVEANEEDVLDIDSNVRLDETEEDVGDQTLQENKVEESQPTLQEEDEEDFEEQKERNRFNNERNQNQAIHRLTSNEIPDCLEKVAVPPFNNPNNYQRNNNGRYHRGRGRGRGRNFNNHPGNNRPSVFGRVGHVPGQMENKKVLINPHFRGNVQVNENARLVWDPNSPAPNQQHPRFPNNQVIPVAPFQAHPSPWVVPPYPEQNNTFNQAHQVPHNYQDQPAQQQQYNQGPGQDLRPLMQMNNQFPQNQPMTNWCEETTYNCEPLYQSQANFRGREVRFNQPNSQQVLINPQPNFNQQTQRNFIQLPQQRPPLLNQPNIPPLLPMPQQPQQQHQQQQQQQQQQFAAGQQNNQFMNQPHQHQQFPPQNQFQHQFPQQPVFGQHQQVQVYDFENSNQFQQNYGYNYAGPKPPHHGNYQPAAPPNFNQMGGFQAGQEQFQQPHQIDNNRQFIRNENNQQRGNNRSFNQMNNRTPPKRRTFEPKNNNHTINSGERDLPKKKRRSLELSNLHQVPTVDMPDTTTEDKGEEEDEETKAYRKKIEEQKKLREKIVQQKEERRKLAAASKQQREQQTTNSNPKNQPNNNLINTIKTNKPIVAVKTKVPPQQQQQQQQNKRNLNQQKLQQQPPQQLQKKNNPVNNVPQQQQQQQQQNVLIRRRLNEQQSAPANIVITQKQQQQPQRIVMVKQPQTNQQSQQNKSNRRVILKGSNNKEIRTTATATNANVVGKNEDASNLSSFLSNRKVIAASAKSTAPSGGGGDNKSFNINEGLIETPIVVVSNLAASTTDLKIRTMCQGLGPIQTIEMIPNSRQATITFKNVLSAHKFFKKFHRKIIDLSMIQVTLEALT